MIVETKHPSDIDDLDVCRKAKAAVLWCMIATDHHAVPHGEKPWRYVLVPDHAVQPNATLAGLISTYAIEADLELKTRYTLSKEG